MAGRREYIHLIITKAPQGIRSSATPPLHGRPLWEASPLGDLTAENLRPEAGLPQGVPRNCGNPTTCGASVLIKCIRAGLTATVGGQI